MVKKGSDRDYLFWALVTILFLVTQLVLFLNTTPVIFPDSKQYLSVSKLPFFSSQFWFGDRPFVIPIILKILRYDFDRFFVFQFIHHAVTWILSAWFLSRIFEKRWLKKLAYMVFLGFAASTSVSCWNCIALSDEVSNSSMMMVIVFSYLALIPQYSKWAFYMLVPSSIIFAFTRDLNPYVLCVLGLVCGLFLLSFRVRKLKLDALTKKLCMFFLVVGPILLVSQMVQYSSSKVNSRATLVNNIGKRVLTDPDATQFFVDHGMPLTPGVLVFKGKSAWVSDISVFQPWLDEKGRSTFYKFFLHRPLKRAIAPVLDSMAILNPTLTGYRGSSFPLQWWEKIIDFVFFPTGFRFVFFCLLSAIIIVQILLRKKWDWRLSIPFVIYLIAYPQAFLVWYGDPDEIGRHSIGLIIQMKLALFIVPMVYLDRVVRRSRQKLR